MAFCPKCNAEVESSAVVCLKCGHEVEAVELIVIGTIDDQVSADMAREVLASHGIRAGVFSNSGFFGRAGLPLAPVFNARTPQYEVTVEAGQGDEAIELLEMTIGDNFHRRDN